MLAVKRPEAFWPPALKKTHSWILCVSNYPQRLLDRSRVIFQPCSLPSCLETGQLTARREATPEAAGEQETFTSYKCKFRLGACALAGVCQPQGSAAPQSAPPRGDGLFEARSLQLLFPKKEVSCGTVGRPVLRWQQTAF